jgi:hypothetical protein
MQTFSNGTMTRPAYRTQTNSKCGLNGWSVRRPTDGQRFCESSSGFKRSCGFTLPKCVRRTCRTGKGEPYGRSLRPIAKTVAEGDQRMLGNAWDAVGAGEMALALPDYAPEK